MRNLDLNSCSWEKKSPEEKHLKGLEQTYPLEHIWDLLSFTPEEGYSTGGLSAMPDLPNWAWPQVNLVITFDPLMGASFLSQGNEIPEKAGT